LSKLKNQNSKADNAKTIKHELHGVKKSAYLSAPLSARSAGKSVLVFFSR